MIICSLDWILEYTLLGPVISVDFKRYNSGYNCTDTCASEEAEKSWFVSQEGFLLCFWHTL